MSRRAGLFLLFLLLVFFILFLILILILLLLFSFFFHVFRGEFFYTSAFALHDWDHSPTIFRPCLQGTETSEPVPEAHGSHGPGTDLLA